MQNFGKSSLNSLDCETAMRTVMANALHVQELFIATPSKADVEKFIKKKWTKDTVMERGTKWKSPRAKSVKEVNSKSKR